MATSFKATTTVCLRLALALALAATVADSADLRSRVTSQCTISSKGVHKCPKYAPQETNGLDPRAETFFKKKIPVSVNSFTYEFKANYFVTSAKETTIAQFLNQDLSVSDEYKPVLFIVAWKKANNLLKICMFQSCIPEYVWDDVPLGFRLEIVASGKKAQVEIAGAARVFDLVSPLNGAYRPRGNQEVRWGVYHHDISNKKAASDAQVRVYNIESKGF